MLTAGWWLVVNTRSAAHATGTPAGLGIEHVDARVGKERREAGEGKQQGDVYRSMEWSRGAAQQRRVGAAGTCAV